MVLGFADNPKGTPETSVVSAMKASCLTRLCEPCAGSQGRVVPTVIC